MPRSMEAKHRSLDSTLQILGNVSKVSLTKKIYRSIDLNIKDNCEMYPLWLGGRKRVEKV